MRTPRTARVVILTACLGLLLIARMGPGPAAAQDRDFVSSRVSLGFVDTDVRDALRMIADQSGVNIVVSNQVEGQITLDLDNATLSETLDAISSVGGYEYAFEDNLIKVRTLAEVVALAQRESGQPVEEFVPPPLPIIDEIIRLDYVDAERIQPIVEKMLSENGSVTLLRTPDHLAQERGVADTGTDGESSLQIGTQLETSTHGQPASSHTLLVHDHEDRVERILEIVQELDQKPVQVVIEARFVEISLDDDDALGLDWNVLARVSGGASPHTGPFFGDSLGAFDPNVVGGRPDSPFPNAPAVVSTLAEPGLFTFGTLDFTSFTALLEMIQRQSRVQMVSNPRVVVGDRHTATILVGERYPILSANVSEFGSVTEQLDHYEPIGVQLAVTPSVVAEDEIQLLVRPSTSSLGPLVEGSTGLSVARINSRQIDTSVTVRDGQTVVLGGLITTRDVEIENSVPLLGSLPILGKLFSHRSNSSERVDLVVFLTVNIISDHSLTEAQRRLFDDTTLGGDLPLIPAEDRSQLEYTPSPPRY